MTKPAVLAKPGRPPKGTGPLTFRAQSKARDAIDTAKLVKQLRDHALGDLKLTPTQIRCAEILLNKTLPNLSATEFNDITDHDRPETMTDHQLELIAGGKGSA